MNEVFETIQGEAGFTGTPSLFVRLQGCPVGCPWCDTKHTWEVDEVNRVLIREMLEKARDARTWARMSAGDVVEIAAGRAPRHVVLTGGEPCMYDLRELTGALIDGGKTVQIETSGTYPVQCDSRVWVTVSPKIGMPGGLAVRHDAVERANEIKMPVGKRGDVEKLLDFLETYLVPARKVWLQPLSCSERATALCVEEATRHGWRVSVQTHKFIGVR